MRDSFCALPFMHFNVMPSGAAHLCCTSPTPLKDAAGNPLNIKTHTLEEIWSAPAYRKIRMQMMRGHRPRECGVCWHAEDNGFQSVRTNYNALILGGERPGEAFTGFTKVSREVLQEYAGPPTYFDLRFDNVCNLQCVMCFASESSSIEADPVQTAWTGELSMDRSNRFGNSRKWVASDELFDELKTIGEKAEYIRLAGGEPFRSALALRWMDHLAKSGRAQNVTLQIYTNLHRFNEQIIAVLRQFKYVAFVLSIDGVGSTYEYIRYPGKWSTVERNVDVLLGELHQGSLRGEVTINATMSIPGAMRITEVLDFGDQRGIGVTLSNACDPPHVSTRYLPEAAKDRLERTLRHYGSTHPRFDNLAGEIDQWLADMRSTGPTTPGHTERVRDAMRFINDMDRSRQLDFKALQPDLVDDFIQQTGSWAAEVRFAGRREEGSSIGTVAEGAVRIGDLAYQTLEGCAGSIENFEDHGSYFQAIGWALDRSKGSVASSVVAVVGDDVVSSSLTTIARPDIVQGFGENALNSGFSIKVPKLGNRPTADQPVRLFALMPDGVAQPLAADFPNEPVTFVEFR